MKMKQPLKLTACLAAILGMTAGAWGQTIVLTFDQSTGLGTAIDLQETATYTQSGVEFTFSATSVGASDISLMNAVSDGVGINAQVDANDDSARIDGDSADGNEIFRISADTDITLTSATFSNVTGSDGGQFQFTGGSAIASISDNGTGTGGDTVALSDTFVGSGTEFEILYSGGSTGYTFYTLTVEVSAIPEPLTYAAITGLLALGAILYRHRQIRSRGS